LTSKLGKDLAKNRKQKDFDDMFDENADSSDEDQKEKRKQDKVKMRKLKKKKRNIFEEEEDPQMIKEMRKETVRKFDKIKLNLNTLSHKVQEVEENKDPTRDQDSNAQGKLKKEKDKFSNVNFLTKIAQTELNHGDLTYGSYIILNIENDGKSNRKLCSKFRISDKLQAIKMDKEDYDLNCVFRIIPQAQTTMQTKMLKLLETDKIVPSVDIDYENFMSEMEANIDLQDEVMGKPVKYDAKFQLIQESSKRFLSINESNSYAVKNIFPNGYTDSYCFYFGFSEYPSKQTHFNFKECCTYQREGAGTVKDDHFFYLCTLYNNKSLYTYSDEKYLVMTQSYKTPISYDLVRESETFDEIEDVQSSEVVLLTYANDNFYLNVPHKLNKETGDYNEGNILFQKWQNNKDIDFNGWFMIEYDEDNNQVHLKHFNSNKYVTIVNGEDDDDHARLEVERDEDSQVIFEPINTTNNNVMDYTTHTVFKVRAFQTGQDNEDNYLRFNNNEDDTNYQSNKNDKQQIFNDDSNETVPLVVRNASLINLFDTFNLVFPNDDTYRELFFSKDSFLQFQFYIKEMKRTDDLVNYLEHISHAIYKMFLKLHKFITNNLEGRINADYDVDEIVDYRQEMIAKVGILSLMFDFFGILLDFQGDNDEDEWSEQINQIFKIDSSDSSDFDSTLELVFELLHNLLIDNSVNQTAASINIETMQHFVFVPNISKVLIAIFKDKQFEMNKKEIHREILYRRIYEYDRFQPIVLSFVEKLKKTRKDQYIYILRKI
jgi:hypothetical protein